jgi:hypothetical protein
MTGRVTVAALLLSSGLGAMGCLPADTRPEPGRVYVTADLPSDLRGAQTTPGQLTFTTEDGWAMTLTRLFVSMGGIGFPRDNESCSEYSEAGYRRVLDMQQPGPQKLGQVWGLNGCLLTYTVSAPGSQAVLGQGVTASDRDFMQNAIVPASSDTGITTKQGMALHLQGSAEKSGVVASFDWGFADRLNWTNCQRRINGALEGPFQLVGGETIDINIEVDPRSLFQAGVENAASTDASTPVSLVQLMVDADQQSGNANGRIAVDELINVAMPSELSALNLAEFMRQKAYPSIFGFARDGQCIPEPDERGPGGGM